MRAPAFPVVAERACPPLPRSSGSAWIMMERPTTLYSPNSWISGSTICPVAIPSLPASILPKSPTCLSSSVGQPWVFLNGLKWGPADTPPFEKSANSWTWKPCNPGVRPDILKVIVVGPPCEDCSKLMTPVQAGDDSTPWHGLPAGLTTQIALNFPWFGF